MPRARQIKKAAISPTPNVQAGVGYAYTGGNSPVGDFIQYQEGYLRNLAMSIATISRARDLMASVIACMPLEMYGEQFDDATGEMIELPLAPRSWLKQPDPSVTYPFIMSWTFEDLLMFGRAFWVILERTADGFPSKFTRIPAASVQTLDQPNTGVWFGPSKQIEFAGQMLDPNDVVQFLSPIEGIVYTSMQTIRTALKIEEARYRNASSAIPAGVLKQTGGEPLSAQELADLAASFNQARATNQTCALNEFLDYQPTDATPDKMLLIESANYSALDLARLCSVPPYLVGVSTGAYSYQSSEQARADLYIFGVKAYADCIASTLSMNNVLPRGTYVKFDTSTYLAENYAADMAENSTIQENTQEELA